MSQYSLLRWKPADGMPKGTAFGRLLRRLGPVPPPPRRYFSKYAQRPAYGQRRLPR
jgi:hypothetical protein